MFWNHKASKEASEQVAKMAELGAFEQAIQSQVPFILFTPAGMVTFVNDLFLKIVGFQREEVIGKHHSALCFPEDVKTPVTEAIATLKEAGIRPLRPLAVTFFTNEEGVRFQPDMMGSVVFAGEYPGDLVIPRLGAAGFFRIGVPAAQGGSAAHRRSADSVPPSEPGPA